MLKAYLKSYILDIERQALSARTSLITQNA